MLRDQNEQSRAQLLLSLGGLPYKFFHCDTGRDGAKVTGTCGYNS